MATRQYPATLWLCLLTATLGSMQLGYQLGVLNPSLSHLARDMGLSGAQKGAVMTVLVCAASFGALLSGTVADGFGLRASQMGVAALYLVGSMISGLAPSSYPIFLCGRGLCGAAVGSSSLLAPRFIAEVSPAEVRGALTAQNQVGICTGILVAYLLGLPYERGIHSVTVADVALRWWQVPLLLGCGLALAQMALLAVLPESPVWLAYHGQHASSVAVYAQLWGPEHEHPPLDVLLEESEADEDCVAHEPLLMHTGSIGADTRGQASAQATPELTIWQLVFQRKHSVMIALAIGLPVFQQLGGINTVIFYSADVLAQCGIRSPVLGTAIIGAVNVVMTFVSAALVDQCGRRVLWLVSHAGCAASLAALAATIMLRGLDGAAGVCFVCMLAFIAFFAIGAGPIAWLYLSEILPNDIKGPVAALATASNWGMNVVIAGGFPLAVQAIGLSNTYLILGVINVCAVTFGLVLMVETRQMSMAAIQSTLLL